jgi:serine/threonine protein kinase
VPPLLPAQRQVIDDPAGSKLLLVMEYMEGGPVLTREALEKRERIPESLALQYFRDMVKALDYMHGNKVVHGDLKVGRARTRGLEACETRLAERLQCRPKKRPSSRPG